MRLAIALAAAASIVAIQGCASDMAGRKAASAEPSAAATLADAAGAAKGSATVTEAGSALKLVANVTGMAPGTYGIHFHMVGKCDAPGFTTAGAHWNPTARQHGINNPQGTHLGDLPNITVGADGTGRIEASVPNAKIAEGANALLDTDGAALVIHAAADDYRTDPSGNSGARVACGVLTRA